MLCFRWRTEAVLVAYRLIGDTSHAESYAEGYEQYKLDGFGSASPDDIGSGPADGVRAAEPATGRSDAARAGSSSSGTR